MNAIGNAIAATSATARSHLICWRSTEVPRRKRDGDGGERPDEHGQRDERRDRVERLEPRLERATPNGFRIVGVPLIGPGMKAGRTIAESVPTTSSHASQRHRGDGRWPSG